MPASSGLSSSTFHSVQLLTSFQRHLNGTGSRNTKIQLAPPCVRLTSEPGTATATATATAPATAPTSATSKSLSQVPVDAGDDYVSATAEGLVGKSFLTEDEVVGLSPEQVAFLIRKRKAAAGLGPVMPESSQCNCCSGIGTRTCHQCHGTGANAIDKAEEIFDSEIGVYARNGLIDVEWMFMKGGPCWLCKGQGHVACPDCSGTGISGGVDRYTGD